MELESIYPHQFNTNTNDKAGPALRKLWKFMARTYDTTCRKRDWQWNENKQAQNVQNFASGQFVLQELS